MAKERSTSKDKRLLVGKDMPPLYRTQPDEKYSYKTDDVFKWISERPGLINFIFDKLVANKYIFYDSDTGKWQGVDYEED